MHNTIISHEKLLKKLILGNILRMELVMVLV